MSVIEWKKLSLKEKVEVIQSLIYGTSAAPIPVHRFIYDYLKEHKGNWPEFMERKFKPIPTRTIKIGRLTVKI